MGARSGDARINYKRVAECPLAGPCHVLVAAHWQHTAVRPSQHAVRCMYVYGAQQGPSECVPVQPCALPRVPPMAPRRLQVRSLNDIITFLAVPTAERVQRHLQYLLRTAMEDGWKRPHLIVHKVP